MKNNIEIEKILINEIKNFRLTNSKMGMNPKYRSIFYKCNQLGYIDALLRITNRPTLRNKFENIFLKLINNYQKERDKKVSNLFNFFND